MSKPLHVYLSTACMHELHDRCRKTCKFCSEPCICSCHDSMRTSNKPSGAIVNGPLADPPPSPDLMAIEGWVPSG